MPKNLKFASKNKRNGIPAKKGGRIKRDVLVSNRKGKKCDSNSTTDSDEARP